MSEKKLKAQRVILDQVKKHAGDSSSGIAWRYLGGRFENGRAIGTVTISAVQLVFALNTKARVSELARQGKLSRKSRPTCFISGTYGDGYWPSGVGTYSSASTASVERESPVVVKQGTAKPAGRVADAEFAANIVGVLKDEF